MTPQPPTNVRLVRDGAEIPLECAYEGVHLGLHMWAVVAPAGVTVEPHDQIRVDELPGQTSIVFKGGVVTGRLRRRVVDLGADGYGVTNSTFTTTDHVLAEAVAQRLDGVDPLPCPHGGDWIDIRSFSDPEPVEICSWCGATRDGELFDLGGMSPSGYAVVQSMARLTRAGSSMADVRRAMVGRWP